MTTARTFDAGILSRGWLATHLATGSDEEVPALYGTLGGAKKAIAVEVGIEPTVTGVVMPVALAEIEAVAS